VLTRVRFALVFRFDANRDFVFRKNCFDVVKAQSAVARFILPSADRPDLLDEALETFPTRGTTLNRGNFPHLRALSTSKDPVSVLASFPTVMFSYIFSFDITLILSSLSAYRVALLDNPEVFLLPE